MPRLWESSIGAHRQSVRGAAIRAAGALVSTHGLRGVTMSRIADDAGVSRATLYRYFPDVESILQEWHEQHVREHLEALADIASRPGEPIDRLEAVLCAYARIEHEQPRDEIATQLHDTPHAHGADEHVLALLVELLTQCADAGSVRSDIAPRELAVYCVDATRAARRLRSKAAVRRLVELVLAGLKAPIA